MIGTALLLASLLTSASGEPAESARDVEARWRREYPRAAGEWDSAARGFVAKGSYSFRWLSGGTDITKELTVAASGDKRLICQDRVTHVSPSSPERPAEADVQCRTPEIMFKLIKKSSSKDFLIEYFQEYKENNKSEFNYEFKHFARSATDVDGTSILGRMQDSSFVLKSIEALERDGVKLVRIAYTLEDKKNVESGVVDLEPGNRWAIRSVELTYKNKAKSAVSTHTMVVDYKKVDDAHFFPSRMEFFDREADPEVYQHGILEYDRITLGRPADSLFRMTAYGMPDLPLRPSPRASVFTLRNPVLWLALAATVTSFALLWFMRSRKARAA